MAKINKDQPARFEAQLSIESMSSLFFMAVLNLPVSTYEGEVKFS